MDQNISSVSKSDQNPVKEDAAARWQKLIQQQQESGLPVSAYCRSRGLSAASMLAVPSAPTRKLTSRQTFKPVKIVPAATLYSSGEKSDSAIELCLPGEHRLVVRRGFDRGVAP